MGSRAQGVEVYGYGVCPGGVWGLCGLGGVGMDPWV